MTTEFRVSFGTVQPYIVRQTPHEMIHFGRAEYDRKKPVLTDSLREQGQAVCDALNAGEITLDAARQQLKKVYF